MTRIQMKPKLLALTILLIVLTILVIGIAASTRARAAEEPSEQVKRMIGTRLLELSDQTLENVTCKTSSPLKRNNENIT